MTRESADEVLEQLRATRRLLAGARLPSWIEGHGSKVALQMQDLERRICREIRKAYRDEKGAVLSSEQLEARALASCAYSGSRSWYVAFLAVEAEPEVDVVEGDVLVLARNFATTPSAPACDVVPIRWDEMPRWRDHWMSDRLEEVFVQTEAGRDHHASFIPRLWEAIRDRRAWGRKGPKSFPRLHLLKPHDRSRFIRPPQRRRTVSETIVASSDAAAIFELLSDCGGIPPLEDSSGGGE